MTTTLLNSAGQLALSVSTSGSLVTLTAGSDGFIRSVGLVGQFDSFTWVASTGIFQSPTLTLGLNSADLEFATTNANSGKVRFDSGDSITYKFFGTGPVSVETHIQGLPWGSEKITATIPEPGSILLGAIGILLLLRRRR